MPKAAAKKARRTRATKPKPKKKQKTPIKFPGAEQGWGKLTHAAIGGELIDLSKAPNAFSGQPPRVDGTVEGINVSQLNEYMLCPWRWHLKFRRQITSRYVEIAPDLGSAVHAGIAGAIRFHSLATSDMGRNISKLGHLQFIAFGIRDWKKEWIKEHLGDHDLSDELNAQLDEITVTANEIAVRAIEDLDLERWEVVYYKKEPLVERKISIPFLDGIPFYGTPDVVWKDRDKGGNWVVDYKVRKVMQPVEQEEVDLQLPAYQYMLMKLGIPTAGSIKVQVRSRLPEIPSLNKNGTMSRQRILTTWEIYASELLKHNLKLADYQQEMQQKLDAEFFRLDRLYRNQFEITSFWDNIIVPLGRQLVESKEFIRHMHASAHCRGCWARELCLAELRGEDNGFLLETQYYDANSPKPKLAMRPEDFTFEED